MATVLRNLVAAGAGLLLAACATTTPLPTPPSLDTVEANLARDIETLASDEFGGRFPGTLGEAKTAGFLVRKFTEIGLQPGMGAGAPGGGWAQGFTLVRRTPKTDPAAAEATITRGQRSITLDDGLLGVHSGRDSVNLADVPIVGVDPELEDLKAGSLVNRALALPASDLQRRAPQMAAAHPKAVIVTTTDDAQYEMASGLLSRGRWRLENDGEGSALMLLTPEDSARLTKLIGRNAEREPDGLGVIAYDTILRGSIEQEVERIETANILGRLPGAVEGAGAVLVLAHWDHLGDECAPPDAPDRLCNGAVDNASGIAVMTEAVRLAMREGPLDRDLIVLATSSEELGLLGAEAFVADPPVPLPTIVAAFNIDTIAVAPRGMPLSVIGWGRTPLDAGIETVVAQQGRSLALADWHQQFLRRQDGWALLSRDVPTVLVSSAAADEAAFGAFMNGNYHSPDDEFSADLELGGAAEDAVLHAALIRYFGSLATYPGGAAD